MTTFKENRKPKACLVQGVVLFVIFTLGNLVSAIVYAEENQLQIKPTRCIALHEGQVCYQTLTIIWKAEVADTYCLHQQASKTPIVCWENVVSGKTRYEFEGDATQKFMLLRKQDGKLIAEFTLEVAWVYDAKTRRESHWRVF